MYWNSRQVTEKRTLPFAASTRDTARAALGVAAGKVERLAEQHPDYFPLYTHEGRWKHGKESWTNWCEGFLGGQMWLFHELGLGDQWRARAEHYSVLVEQRQHDRDVHDLGFVLCPTWQKWAELDGGTEQKKVVVQGGRTMALRLNDQGGFLRSFLAPDSNFIDIMMNIGIIALAALETGDDNLMAIARRHCDTTRKYLVRGDGSVSHEGIYDLGTGEFLRQTTQQGWRNDSSWARGLAWSLYGFTSMYALTGDTHLLRTAIANADYWIEHTQADPVPPNDFDEPHPTRPWESSAAACAAGGLIMLAALVEDDTLAQRYHRHAETTVRRLCEPLFLGIDPAWEGVLKHGSYHERKGLGVDESVMWGDYFFVETLARVVRG
ncbi:glycoside hydrolase family 88 protein [Actinoplanes sp. NBRC 101535]|uniref:glycoside hydrolase family 88 protein n=1 Tax=Actinoplanes sp. NBRC 101535 TaxID=3032196 RepID=UPI0024A2A13E|nr:glycoside hydrolase family 88 protein [Actinoplanes sp. NBRC 101535]GLY02394.1 glucuronyl hydrolase [Actinoplanes sp. NBRC 101535]